MKYTAPAKSEHWEPLKIRDLIRQAHMNGHHPNRLFLGQAEANSFRNFLSKNFEETVPDSFTDTYYLGLKVEETIGEHLIAIDGEQSRPNLSQDLPPLGNNAAPEPRNEISIASDLVLFHKWNEKALRELVQRKSTTSSAPAFLFLGLHEAHLLRKHLGNAFGSESVRSLKNIYYLGMEVIELQTDYFLRTSGRKRVQNFRKKSGRTPRWKDIADGSLWQPAFK